MSPRLPFRIAHAHYHAPLMPPRRHRLSREDRLWLAVLWVALLILMLVGL